MQTVFVDVKAKREIARDARDPFTSQQAIERVADCYSRGSRLVNVFPTGMYCKPWRENRDPLYQSLDGKATLDYRTTGA